jgi:hypothetical protein
VIFEIEEPENLEEELVLVEYKYSPIIGNEKALGIPRFMHFREIELTTEKAINFARSIVENDYENRMFEEDIKDIKAYTLKDVKGTYRFNICVFFKREERFYLDSHYPDR